MRDRNPPIKSGERAAERDDTGQRPKKVHLPGRVGNGGQLAGCERLQADRLHAALAGFRHHLTRTVRGDHDVGRDGRHRFRIDNQDAMTAN